MNGYVLHLRQRIIFSKNKWEFSFYFQKLVLVLFYSTFHNLRVDTFPCRDFFLHASYRRVDEVNHTINNSDNEAFRQRFVCRPRPDPAPPLGATPAPQAEAHLVYENEDSARKRQQLQEEIFLEEDSEPEPAPDPPKRPKPRPAFRDEARPARIALLTGEMVQRNHLPESRGESSSESQRRARARQVQRKKKKAQKRREKEWKQFRHSPTETPLLGLSNLVLVPRQADHKAPPDRVDTEEQVYVECESDKASARDFAGAGLSFSTPQKENWHQPRTAKDRAKARYFSSHKEQAPSPYESGSHLDSPVRPGLQLEFEGQSRPKMLQSEPQKTHTVRMEPARLGGFVGARTEALGESECGTQHKGGGSERVSGERESRGESGSGGGSDMTRRLKEESLKIAKECELALKRSLLGEKSQSRWLDSEERGKAVAVLEESIQRLNKLHQKVDSRLKSVASE